MPGLNLHIITCVQNGCRVYAVMDYSIHVVQYQFKRWGRCSMMHLLLDSYSLLDVLLLVGRAKHAPYFHEVTDLMAIYIGDAAAVSISLQNKVLHHCRV